jgi:hypothetical protein
MTGTKLLTKRLGALSVATIALMSGFAFLCLAVLHLTLVGVLRRIKDIHWPLAADGALDNDWEVPPD